MVDYHTTQMLTGYGCSRFKRFADLKCVYCQFSNGDAEHAIFKCNRWWSVRKTLEEDIGMLFEPETIVEAMLECKRK